MMAIQNSRNNSNIDIMINHSDPKQSINKKYRNNASPNNGLKIENSEIMLDTDTDAEIEENLPLHPKGFKNHWAAIMKAQDDEQLEMVSLTFYNWCHYSLCTRSIFSS